MLRISFISTTYIILFELKEYLCIILVFSCSIFIFATKTCCFFSFNKNKNWFAALTNAAILKTKLLAGNDHVIDIFSGEDMENISLSHKCVPYSILIGRHQIHWTSIPVHLQIVTQLILCIFSILLSLGRILS